MLGMISGWSSTFEPETAVTGSAVIPKKEATGPETPPMKRVPSFDGILTDYAIGGCMKYASKEYGAQLSQTEKVRSLKFDNNSLPPPVERVDSWA